MDCKEMNEDGIVTRKCRYCGKKFVPAPQHALKDTYGMYCKPTCYLHGANLTKSNCKVVLMYRGDELLEEFKTATAAAQWVSGEPKLIRDACRKGTKYKGYTWKYEE